MEDIVELEIVGIESNIDPRIQQLLDRRQRGVRPGASASTSAGEVAVIAKVADRDTWVNMSEVRPGADLGGGPEFGGFLVTGRIPASRIEHVRSQVISLKPAQGVRRALAAGTQETNARREQLPAGASGNQGAGVVVGVVDFGCDFAHRNFLNADGTTRLLAIWDQGGAAGADSPFGYGRLHTRERIDAALASADPYATLGYAPPADSAQERGTHGTHVMDIAAGNGRGSGVPGMAPNADLVFVELASSDIPWSGADVVGSTFGDSVQLLEAVRFIVDVAAGRPCVVNLSLGTNGGPHDGTTLVEQGLDALASQAPNRAIVIAASNSFADGIHAAGNVAAGGSTDVRWVVPQGDFTHNELEIWYSATDEFRLELIEPSGASLGSVALGRSGRVTDQGQVKLMVAHRRRDPNNGDNVIGVFLESGLPTGTWTMRLHGVAIANGRFHAWIERDDAGQSHFAEPHDNSHTLGTISCGRRTVVVGSYDAHKPAKPISWFSSAGPTRDGRGKPEISAPGHDVLAAHSRTVDRVTSKSGTSMAAPATAGAIALMLAEAATRGASLSAEQIAQALISTARPGPPNAGAWDPRYGNGRLDAATLVAHAMTLAATATPLPRRRRLPTRPRRRPTS